MQKIKKEELQIVKASLSPLRHLEVVLSVPTFPSVLLIRDKKQRHVNIAIANNSHM